jgi:cyanophycinase-like exopeptidase
MPGKIFAGQLRVFPTPLHRVRTALTQPVYLLADSQLLFRRDRGSAFLDGLRARLPGERASAAYVGASNGDDPDLYGIFTAAMEGLGVARTRMIPSSPGLADEAFLATADLVLLAGGDVERGWRAMEAGGLRRAILRRHREGGLLVGVSAGAVQLGMLGWPEGDPSPERVFPTFGLVPFVVDAHAEAGDWSDLRRVVRGRGGALRGLGIPLGGGVVLHPDGAVEAVRHPATEIVCRADGECRNLLFPASP